MAGRVGSPARLASRRAGREPHHDRSLRGRELRQNSPFAGVLPAAERDRIIASWQRKIRATRGEPGTARGHRPCGCPHCGRWRHHHPRQSVGARLARCRQPACRGDDVDRGRHRVRDDPDGVKADRVDGAIGELSSFHEMNGYYAQGVSISTAVLPVGWEDRVVPLDRQDAHPGYARCLETHDLVVAKLVAGREKDVEFAEVLIAAHMVDPDVLEARAATIDRPGAVVNRVHRQHPPLRPQGGGPGQQRSRTTPVVRFRGAACSRPRRLLTDC